MRRLLTCLLGLALCNSLVSAQTVMTNATVIKMTKAGLTENVIISSIESHPGNYSTNPDDLIALKNARVSDKVIAAIIAKTTAASSTPVFRPRTTPTVPSRLTLTLRATPGSRAELWRLKSAMAI